MSAAPALSAAYPPVGAVAGGGASSAQADGVRLLGLVQRMKDTGMAMARCINRIARQRLEGQPLSRLAPPGFNPTATNALVVQAVAWLAALRERLMATVRPGFVPPTGRVKAARAPQGRGAADYMPDAVPNPTADDWHDWWDLAKPLRIGPGGVAAAAQQIAGLSTEEVVTGVNRNLSQALTQFGADADVPLITAVAAEARTLLAKSQAAEAAGAVAELEPVAEPEPVAAGVAAALPPGAPPHAPPGAPPHARPGAPDNEGAVERPPKPPD